MFEVTITEVYQTVWRYHRLSRHWWCERGRMVGYEVSGGGWFFPSRHRKLACAEKEKASREAFTAKFPPPPIWRSEREIAKSKRLGLRK